MTDNTTLRAALAYARKGIAVCPLAPWDAPDLAESKRGKIPVTKHGLKDATTDEAQLTAWWTSQPGWNLGIPTGTSAGFWVMDVDGPEGAASLAALEAKHGALPETPEQATARGRHICFLWDPDRPIKNSQSRHARHGFDPRAKIDVRGEGGYIVAAPSMHASGFKYAWHPERRPSKMAFAPAPDWLREVLEWKPQEAKTAALPGLSVVQPAGSKANETGILQASNAPQPATPPGRGSKLITAYGERALRDECDKIRTAQPGTQENTLNTSCFKIGQLVPAEITEGIARTALIEAGMSIARDWTPQDVAEKVERALTAGSEKAARSAPERPPSQRAPQRPEGWKPERITTPAAITTQQEQPDEAPQAEVVTIHGGERYTAATLWQRSLLKNEEGKLKPTLENAMLILQNHDDMVGSLAFDLFTRRVVLVSPPAWADDNDAAKWEPRALTDNDVTYATGWLERQGVPKSTTAVHSACLAVAQRNSFDPAVDWLESLKWDRTERLSGWLTQYLGADDRDYTRSVARKFLIGAVARILRPGCKVDTMLILEGDQGLGKSKAARILGTFGARSFFTDEIGDIGSKDAAMQLQGVAIVEIAELNTFKRAEVNAIKAWLTRTVDRYRPPYGRSVVEAPRRCVLIGTMNPDGTGYLTDSTGGRRFWPVLAKGCDEAELARIQPQLWAEAVTAFHANEPWWMTSEEEIADAKAEQEERYDGDAWAEKIDDFLFDKNETTTAEVIAHLGVPIGQNNTFAKMRVAKHLSTQGWAKGRRAHGHRERCFLRPSNLGGGALL